MCARNHKSTLCYYYVNAAAATDKLIHIPVHLGSGTLINLELKRYIILLLLLL